MSGGIREGQGESGRVKEVREAKVKRSPLFGQPDRFGQLGRVVFWTGCTIYTTSQRGDSAEPRPCRTAAPAGSGRDGAGTEWSAACCSDHVAALGPSSRAPLLDRWLALVWPPHCCGDFFVRPGPAGTGRSANSDR